MIIDNAGTYTLKYTATDECGKTTEVERELIVERPPATYRTVLYTDGTFIINESSYDMDDNIAEHGEATNVYDAFDPNGDTNVKRYVFSSKSQRPWESVATSIINAKVGSEIHPTSVAFWFHSLINCTSIDVSNLKTENIENMQSMFYECKSLTSLDLSGFNTSNVTDMQSMFYMCKSLTSLDLSSFNTSNVTNMYMMFAACSLLATIYASLTFITTQVTVSTDMFRYMSTNLVGGNGTTWASSNPRDKTYARIDGGTSAPGYFTAKS